MKQQQQQRHTHTHTDGVARQTPTPPLAALTTVLNSPKLGIAQQPFPDALRVTLLSLSAG